MIRVTLEGPTMKELLEQAKEVFGPGLLEAVPVPGKADHFDMQTTEPSVQDVIDAAEEEAAKPKAAKKKKPTTRKKPAAKKAVEDKPVDETVNAEPEDEPTEVEAEDKGNGVDKVAEQHAHDREKALSVLLDVYQNGDKQGVIDLLSEYGVKKFTEVPLEQGTELLEKANALAG